MEWQSKDSSRESLKVYKDGRMFYCEPVSRDDRDIKHELEQLAKSKDRVTFQDLFDYFDFGIMFDKDELKRFIKDAIK